MSRILEAVVIVAALVLGGALLVLQAQPSPSDCPCDDISATGTLDVTGASTLTGAVTAEATLLVEGAADIEGTLSVGPDSNGDYSIVFEVGPDQTFMWDDVRLAWTPNATCTGPGGGGVCNISTFLLDAPLYFDTGNSDADLIVWDDNGIFGKVRGVFGKDADGFEMYTFGGGTFDVGSSGASITVNDTSQSSFSFFINGQFDATNTTGVGAQTGIYGGKLEIKSTASGSSFIEFNDGNSTTTTMMILASDGTNAEIAWHENATYTEDITLGRTAANTLSLGGGALLLVPVSAAPFTCDNSNGHGGLYHDSDNDANCCCGDPSGDGNFRWYECWDSSEAATCS